MNILYGIAGEGLGHATRSRPIIEHLQKKHSVHTLVSGNAYTFLKERLKNIHKIEGMTIYYKNNGIRQTATFFYSLLKLPKIFARDLAASIKVLSKTRPDIVITDFESLSWLIGKILGKKIISVDNIHALTHLDIDKIHVHASFSDSWIVRFKTPFCTKYLIPSFFYAAPKKNNAVITAPVLRQEIIDAAPSAKNHILVYQTSKSFKGQLIKTFSAFPKETFLIYGFGEETKERNAHFMAHSEKEFIEDLRSAKAVITNGGFTLITEALHLKKPVLSIPVRKHQEQNVNAHYIEKLGYGAYATTLDTAVMKNFLKKIPEYAKQLRKYKRQDNSEFMRLIDSAIKQKSHSSHPHAKV